MLFSGDRSSQEGVQGIHRTRRGLTLMETLIGTVIFSISAFAIYTSFANLLDLSAVTKRTTAAVAVLQATLETIHDLPYSDVGIVGGSPPGKVPVSQAVMYDGVQFVVNATIRNIDDPFDGVFASDTAPADYKLVELSALCVACRQAIPIAITARVAPKGLETTSKNGALFVKVFDAAGAPVTNANVTVTNTSTNPAILVNDVTNNVGMLQLVDIPTSTGGYRISVSKANYSSDQTYPPGGASNPNPITPHATVVAQQVTQVSFAIDRLGTLGFHSKNNLCGAVGSASFSLIGQKLIGTSPDILKYSTTSATNASGDWSKRMEWDAYTFGNTNANLDITGYMPAASSSTFPMDPSSTQDVTWILANRNRPALLVSVVDQNGVFVADASVTIAKAGFSSVKLTGHQGFGQTDWSGGMYATTSGGVSTDDQPGRLELAPFGGPYATGTTAWLESQTFDLGTATTTLYGLTWNPDIQDPAAGAQAIEFQIASNNDNATWIYRGPDGTGASYYTTPGTTILGNSGSRYVRYKVYLSTQDISTSPILSDVIIEERSSCYPDGQIYWSGLPNGTYAVTVQKSGFQVATSSVTVNNNWQDIKLVLQP